MRGRAGRELTNVADGRASGEAIGLLGFRHVHDGRPRRVYGWRRAHSTRESASSMGSSPALT